MMRAGISILFIALFYLSACANLSETTECYAHPDDELGSLTCTVFPEQLYWIEEDGVYEGDFEIISDIEYGQAVIVDGDVSLGPAREVLAEHYELERAIRSGVSSRVEELTMDVRPRRQWDSVIRYRIHDDILKNPRHVSELENAIAYWNNSFGPLTGIEWERHQGLGRRDKGVYIKPSNDRCSASVGAGAVGRQKRRDMNLATGCFTIDTILHEMAHSMGVRHEHQRHDRDEHIMYIARHLNDTEKKWKRAVAKRANIRRYRAIGEYDINSISHYSSIGSISKDSMRAPVFLPVFFDRGTLDIAHIRNTSVSGGRHSVPRREPSYNDRYRFDNKNVPLSDVHVRDVDGDGFDDLVIMRNGELWWSSQGKGGWTQVRDSNGNPIRSPISRTVFGGFSGVGSADVFVVTGRSHSLYPSMAPRRTVSRKFDVVALASEDLNNDGLSDVFMILSDGSWHVAFGGDILGDTRTLCGNSMGVSEIKLVRLEGTSGPVHAVAWRQNQLEHVDLRAVLGGARCEWRRVFTRARRDPLPNHISSINDLWFVHVDQDRRANAQMDLITYSDGRDGSGMPRGAPVWIPNILGSDAVGMDPIEFARNMVGIDLEYAAVVGIFGEYLPGRARGSFLSLGEIPRTSLSGPDVLGIATRYADWSVTRLARARPRSLLESEGPPAELRIGERFEYEATFISPIAVSDLSLNITRRNRLGASREESIQRKTIRGGGQRKTYRGLFVPEQPGIYRITISAASFRGSPAEPRIAPSASWTFTVPGSVCGDGVREGAEACDRGKLNADSVPNTCRTDCSAPRCGDGVVDSNEACDEGRNNGVGLNPTCLANCALATCGNGVLDDGEECDWGIQNNDAISGACRTTCIFAKCGDGILDDGEECDNGPLNADIPDACRTNCTLPRCGDGIIDSDEQCEGSEYCSDSCYCTDGRVPWLIYGECTKPVG